MQILGVGVYFSITGQLCTYLSRLELEEIIIYIIRGIIIGWGPIPVYGKLIGHICMNSGCVREHGSEEVDGSAIVRYEMRVGHRLSRGSSAWRENPRGALSGA